MFLNVLVIALIAALDQITKKMTAGFLEEIGTYPLISGVFHLTYVENTGAAFSILQGSRLFLTLASLVAVMAIIIYLAKAKPQSRLFRWSLVSVCGGAAGNLIDRAFYGYVIDMFDFRLIGFAIFNVADCFVVVGTILLFVSVVFLEGKKKEKVYEASNDG